MSTSSHDTPTEPSPWLVAHLPLVPPGRALDLAAGGGRHALALRAAGHQVTAVDRDVAALDAIRPPLDEVVRADLESAPWPLADRQFDLVLVANYLHRPLMPAIAAAVAPDGWLIYETFAVGNARFGRPSNPAFLLEENELLTWFAADLTVLAFAHGEVAIPRPAMVQRIVCRRQARSAASSGSSPPARSSA
jgi:SAM-dependent methyltransferase